MGLIFICDECHRIVETRIVDGGVIGNLRCPVPHENEGGENCDGANGEAVRPWSKP